MVQICCLFCLDGAIYRYCIEKFTTMAEAGADTSATREPAQKKLKSKDVFSKYSEDQILICTLYEGKNFKLKEDGEYSFTASLRGSDLKSKIYAMKTSQTQYKFKNLFMWRVSKANFERFCNEKSCVDLSFTTRYAGKTVCAGRFDLPVSTAVLDKNDKGYRTTVFFKATKKFLFSSGAIPAVVVSLLYRDCTKNSNTSSITNEKSAYLPPLVCQYQDFRWSFNNSSGYHQLGEPKIYDERFTLTIILGWILNFRTLFQKSSDAESAFRINFMICGRNLRSETFSVDDEEDLKTYIGDKFAIGVQAGRDEFCRYLKRVVVEIHLESVAANDTAHVIGTAKWTLNDFTPPDFSEIKCDLKIIPPKKTNKAVGDLKAELRIIGRLRKSAAEHIPDDMQSHDDMKAERIPSSAVEIPSNSNIPVFNATVIPDIVKNCNRSDYSDTSSLCATIPVKELHLMGNNLEWIVQKQVLSEKMASISDSTGTSQGQYEDLTQIVEPPVNITTNLESCFPRNNPHVRVYKMEFQCKLLRIRSKRILKHNWTAKFSHSSLLPQKQLLIGKPKDSGINLYTDFDFLKKKLIFVLDSACSIQPGNIKIQFYSSDTCATDDTFVAHASISLEGILDKQEAKKSYQHVNVYTLQNPPKRAGFFHYSLSTVNI